VYLSCEEALRFPLYEADRDAARVHLEPSEVRFAVDSPLEEAVRSEPVSEMGFPK